MKLKDILVLVMFIGLAEVVGITGSLSTVSAIPDWYAYLTKSALNPPSWVFGPVWTVLYAVMGYAGFLVWKKRSEMKKEMRIALRLYGIQLALNLIWTPVFFGLRDPAAGLLVIGLLWLAIAATTAAFFRVSKVAGYLMLPYLAWVTFAAYLNYSIWTLN